MPPPSPSAERSRSRRRRSNDQDERARRARAAQQAAADVSRRVLEGAASARDAAWRKAADENRRRARLLLAVPFLPGVVVAALGALVLPLLPLGFVLLVVWGALAFVGLRAARAGFSGRLGALKPGDAVASGVLSALAAARFADVTESLCAALGLPLPALGVIEDPSLNAVLSGTGETAGIVCTSGILEALDRIELEAVVAHELVHLKRLDTLTGGLSVAVLRGGRLPATSRLAVWLEGPRRELEADLAAVAVTRYPPALITALQSSSEAASGSEPRSLPAPLREETAGNWLLPLRPGDFSAEDRVEVLVEL